MTDPPVGIGEMRVYPHVRPRLVPGRHEVRMTQTITQGGPVQPVTRHVDVTAPRFRLPPGELLSVFPPANAVGAFETRLPQVALRRRTLPWERSAGTPPSGEPDPWLALVVLADGEANFRANVAIDDALPAALRARLGVTEQGTCDVLEVSATVLRQTFPTRDELPLLSHVREVNLMDTEFAAGDDDGWVSVVIANRLPQPGVRYTAYLVSLEGRRDELPAQAAVQDDVGPTHVFPLDPAVLEAASFAHNAALTMALGATRDAAPAPPAGAPVTKAGAAVDSPWAAIGKDLAPAASSAPGRAQASFAGGFLLDAIDFAVIEGADVVTSRFPVLARWSFECDAGGDFQALMQGLDVGLLGTVAPPPVEPGAQAEAAPEVAPTGHTVLDHLTRRGDRARAWYRGAFTPREIRRGAAGTPFHHADQARRIAEDGREDLSEAAAFELGRLLAMAQPRFLAELQSWRRSGFTVRRTRAVLDTFPIVAGLATARLARQVKLALVRPLAEDRPLGPPMPVDDVGHLVGDDDAGVIARGLALDETLVAHALGPGLTTASLDRDALATTAATGLDGMLGDDEALRGLARTRDVAVRRLATPDRETPR